MPRYVADLYADNFCIAPGREFNAIREARRWAEAHGATADKLIVRRPRRGAPDAIIACHMRDRNGNGLRWFRATP